LKRNWKGADAAAYLADRTRAIHRYIPEDEEAIGSETTGYHCSTGLEQKFALQYDEN